MRPSSLTVLSAGNRKSTWRYWNEKARHYDARQLAVPNTIQTIAERFHAEMTLLDVGAGTGRFALLLAAHVRSVTALDHSQAMLEVLQGKLQPSSRVEVVQGSLEQQSLRQQDVVLVAWAMYRCTDLNACLKRLLDLAGRELLIVDDDGLGSPHRQFRTKGQPTSLPRAATLVGALRQLRAQVKMQLIQEEGCLHFTDRDHCLSHLGPRRATSDERNRLLDRLNPYLQESEGELIYRWPFAVTLISVRV